MRDTLPGAAPVGTGLRPETVTFVFVEATSLPTTSPHPDQGEICLMSPRPVPVWPTAVAAAGIVVLLAGVGWVSLVWVRQGAGQADPESSVLGVVLAAVGAAVTLVAWAANQRRIEASPPTAEQVELAAATLAGAVYAQWTDEVQARALEEPAPMPVRWRLAPELMDHAEVVDPDGPVEFSGSSDRIKGLATAFRALPRRRLVITGGPGTGKTTLAVQLNASLPGGLNLTSRVPEYEAAITGAQRRLTGAAMIAPMALTSTEAATYLRHHLPPNPGPDWEDTLNVLTDQPEIPQHQEVRWRASPRHPWGCG
jgi:hypothetical protein